MTLNDSLNPSTITFSYSHGFTESIKFNGVNGVLGLGVFQTIRTETPIRNVRGKFSYGESQGKVAIMKKEAQHPKTQTPLNPITDSRIKYLSGIIVALILVLKAAV